MSKGFRMRIDTSTPFGERVARRLRDAPIVWLVTVDGGQTPQPSPVWFWWDGAEFLVYSQLHTPKVRNVERNRRVAVHLEGDGKGGDIVVLVGDARIVADEPPADRVAAYIEKYRDGIAGLGSDPASFAAEYSTAIRVAPTALRGH
jgi:PPOX class probable F420-dependent enzyme